MLYLNEHFKFVVAVSRLFCIASGFRLWLWSGLSDGGAVEDGRALSPRSGNHFKATTRNDDLEATAEH
jgi:hypothetical protein